MSVIDRIFRLRVVKAAWYRLLPLIARRRSHITRRSHTREIIWGTATPSAQRGAHANIIWSFWDGPPSATVAACRQSWQKHATGFDIHVLTKDSLSHFLPDFPGLPGGIPIQKVSNLVRLMLLERYGGIWMDCSVLLLESLDWVPSLLDDRQCKILAFYNEFHDEYKVDHDRPIIENGFLAAPEPGSPFITEWRRVYQDCITSADYKNFFRNLDDFRIIQKNFIQQSRDYIDYFVCYLAAQFVMLRSRNYRLLLLNAEDEYYRYYYGIHPPRNKRKFAEELLLRQGCVPRASKIVKVPGGHRQIMDEHIRYGCFRRESIVGHAISQSQHLFATSTSD